MIQYTCKFHLKVNEVNDKDITDINAEPFDQYYEHVSCYIFK